MSLNNVAPFGRQVVLDGRIILQTKSPELAWHICCALRAYDESKLSGELPFRGALTSAPGSKSPSLQVSESAS